MVDTVLTQTDIRRDSRTTVWDGRERRSPTRLDDESRARRLLAKVKAGGRDAAAAREALVLQFRPLVQKQARQLMNANVPLEDMVQEGFVGLMHSIDQYDPSRGVKLITYATHHIDGHLRHYLRDRALIIREPAWLQEVAVKVRRQAEVLKQELGREPSDVEIASSVGLSEKEVARINSTRSLFQVSSLDEAQEFGGSAAHATHESAMQPVAEIPIEERLELEHALTRLKEVEQKVLYSFYYEDKNQTEIAKSLGISNNYVSHILKTSTRKLQQMYRSDAVREAALQHETRRRRLSAFGAAGAIHDDVVVSIMDATTGLYTRAHFDGRVEEELTRAKRHNLEMSLVRIAIDGTCDDAFFTQIAHAVKGCTRRSDIVTRFGNREVAALLPHTGQERDIVLDRVRVRLFELLKLSTKTLRVEVGASGFPENTTKAALFAAAIPVP